MEARSVEALPTGPGWQYEPKWDGFRCIARRHGKAVEMGGKSGKDLARYFPEVVATLQAMSPRHFVIDGELVVQLGAHLSFDALQARLHPAASRVARLARETPAAFILFDALAAPEAPKLQDATLIQRRTALECL